MKKDNKRIGGETMYFEYGENEISYLKSKDKKLAEVIEQIGFIKREPDLKK